VKERRLARIATGIVLVVWVTVCLQSVDRITLAADRIDALFAQWNRPDSPGCSVGVSKDGIVEFERGYGMADLEHGIPITPATIFPIASISKQFTAMAVLLLAERRQLSLDDDVRTHIPEIPDCGQRITVRHLLTHTSGLRNGFQLLRLAGWRDEDVVTNLDVLGIMAKQKGANAPPGTEYLYNNSAYTLLAVIVERVSGQSLSAFAGANIFTPLGMKTARFNDDSSVIVPNRASGYYVAGRGDGRGFPGNVMVDADLRDLRVGPARGEPIGPGGAEMTVREILAWQDNFTEPTIGTPAITSQMQTPFTLASGEKTAYGLGQTIGRHRGLVEVGHGGSHVGWDLRVSRYPDRRLTVAVFCNLENIASSTLTRQVADIYLEDVPSPAARAGRA
jgi:CubicO group peptidase (beta-lactamase class C family)